MMESSGSDKDDDDVAVAIYYSASIIIPQPLIKSSHLNPSASHCEHFSLCIKDSRLQAFLAVSSSAPWNPDPKRQLTEVLRILRIFESSDRRDQFRQRAHPQKPLRNNKHHHKIIIRLKVLRAGTPFSKIYLFFLSSISQNFIL